MSRVSCQTTPEPTLVCEVLLPYSVAEEVAVMHGAKARHLQHDRWLETRRGAPPSQSTILQ